MTNRAKQIEEIKDAIDSVYGCDCAYYGVDGFAIAEALYNAGYRKQIECEDVSRFRGVFECSECHWTDEDIGTADQIRFCAGCGAKLKGGA
jgi:hypothetical protein